MSESIIYRITESVEFVKFEKLFTVLRDDVLEIYCVASKIIIDSHRKGSNENTKINCSISMISEFGAFFVGCALNLKSCMEFIKKYLRRISLIIIVH